MVADGNSKSDTWLCPICGIRDFPYGKGCKKTTTCGNKPHLTGQHFVNSDGSLKTMGNTKDGTGISAISNE